jgi:transposase-like protein
MEVKKSKEPTQGAKEEQKPELDSAIVDELMKGYQRPEDKKTLLSGDGKLEIEVPRDRAGEFDPQFIRKEQRRFGGLDQKIIAMYAQGMTVREIQRFLEEQYKVEVSGRSDQHGY